MFKTSVTSHHSQYKSKVTCRNCDGPPLTPLTSLPTILTFTHIFNNFLNVIKMGKLFLCFLNDILKIEYSGVNYKGLMIEYSSLNSKRHLFTHYLTSISIKCISAFYVNCRSRLELVNANKVERILTVEPLKWLILIMHVTIGI